jgi:hypothetical protein
MKIISPALKAHLASAVTTLATCWLIVRTDGVQFSFTTLDADLVVDGVTYKSTFGFQRTAITTTSLGQVDNLEAMGYFSDNGITARDLNNGRFNYATIYLFVVNWADLSMGICRLRRGWFGECTYTPTGAYQAELRGLTQALVQEFGNFYSPLCRADLGDDKCKILIAVPAWLPGQFYAVGQIVGPVGDGSLETSLTGTWQCITAGTTGTTEPAWNFSGSIPTPDGTAVWIGIQVLTERRLARVIGTIDQRSFVSEPLFSPGNTIGSTAEVGMIAGISANTTLEVSDGINTFTNTAFFDMPGSTFYFQALVAPIALNGMGLNMSFEVGVDGFNQVRMTNHSGRQGWITKTGDTAHSVIITQFADNYLDGGTVTWVTGLNAGASMELKTYLYDGQTVILWLAMKYPIAIGDQFLYYAGCDKRRDTCVNKFSNVLNMRGEPDMPGMDVTLMAPEAV